MLSQMAWHARIWVRCVQASKGGPELSLTYAALDMLEQLSSPAEKLAGPELREGVDQPEPSSKVSTDMDSICEARSLPDSHSPLGSATSSLSHRYMLGVLSWPSVFLGSCSPRLLPALGQSHTGLSCALLQVLLRCLNLASAADMISALPCGI